jgi:hypothetical protein
MYRYLMPLNKRVEEARVIMSDENRTWEHGQKERSQNKFILMDTENIDMHSFYHETMKLAEQHENIVTELTEIYSKWYNKISSKGKQPKEMMSMQAAELQSIFTKIYEAIEPLKLELKPPEGYKTK